MFISVQCNILWKLRWTISTFNCAIDWNWNSGAEEQDNRTMCTVDTATTRDNISMWPIVKTTEFLWDNSGTASVQAISNDNMTVMRCSNGVFTAAGPCAGCLSIISDTNIGYKTHSSHYIFITMDRPAAVPRTAAEQHPRFVDVWSCKVCMTQL